MTVTQFAGKDLHNYFLFWNFVFANTDKSEMTIRRAIKRNDFPACEVVWKIIQISWVA